MADSNPPPILDLTTLVRRPKVAVDGNLYEILSPDELSVVDSQRFALWGTDIVTLTADEARGDELEELVDTLARKIAVGVPEELLSKLSGTKKFQLVEVFTMLLLANKAKLVGAVGAILESLEKEKSVTGATSSPASSASLAGRRTTGSSKRRSAS